MITQALCAGVVMALVGGGCRPATLPDSGRDGLEEMSNFRQFSQELIHQVKTKFAAETPASRKVVQGYSEAQGAINAWLDQAAVDVSDKSISSDAEAGNPKFKEAVAKCRQFIDSAKALVKSPQFKTNSSELQSVADSCGDITSLDPSMIMGDTLCTIWDRAQSGPRADQIAILRKQIKTYKWIPHEEVWK